ncbi:hypothetical protein HDF16_003439 [Granulicella aggregans]|uniref:Uncharacterized protein n=1 Tax=Granulicella aggregans TaxID=474949 RepID=A0A7W7ZEY2_9BACT|nr:hypothetical protein [Granulicella aggregans]
MGSSDRKVDRIAHPAQGENYFFALPVKKGELYTAGLNKYQLPEWLALGEEGVTFEERPGPGEVGNSGALRLRKPREQV